MTLGEAGDGPGDAGRQLRAAGLAAEAAGAAVGAMVPESASGGQL
jgi:hypothetical protein